MTDLIVFALGVVAGSFGAFHAGVAAHRRRMRQVARSVPGDSVANATIERLMHDARTTR